MKADSFFKLSTKNCVLLTMIFSAAFNVYSRPLLEIVDVEGVRKNQLVGYGLVVGLQGTGDQTRQTRFTSQSIISMLRQFGVQLPFGVDPKLKNVAAVAVHSTIPTYTREGQTLDVTISSIGDAKSLQGGTLLATPLKGLDGNVYAVAQGSIDIGLGGENSLSLNTVGRIPQGATVEKAIIPEIKNDEIILSLRQGNYTLAYRIVEEIEKIFGHNAARALDFQRISLKSPTDSNERIIYLSMLEKIDVDIPEQNNNKIIVNTRTGTVVFGDRVKIKPVAVTHGNIVVTVDDFFVPKDPDPDIDNENKSNLFIVPQSSELNDIVSIISSIKATPPELSSILQAIKQAGALDGELEIL